MTELHPSNGQQITAKLRSNTRQATVGAKRPSIERTCDMCESQSTIGSVGEADFPAQVLQSTKPVLAVFWAPWSRPCQIMDSVLADLAAMYAGSVKILKVNADDHPYLSLSYDVQFIPSLLCFVGGNLREKLVGTTSKEAVLSLLKRHCDAGAGEAVLEKGTSGQAQ
jgi:thioredoxin-like negative regulator of GroEL